MAIALTPLMHIGIDFGTTNSALAIATGDGPPQLLQMGDAETWRSVLHFDPDEPDPERSVTAGPAAVATYLAGDGHGRLVQSFKSYLASASFKRTEICGKPWTLEALIAAYLARVRAASPVDLGCRAVVGRPVRYWGARDDADDARAVERMRDALALAGFTEVELEYEPVAAARRYAATRDEEELVLTADFGGGTSDFCLMHIAPGEAPRILANAGLGVGGDDFDARIIDERIAPSLGRGTTYTDEYGLEMPVPPWLFTKLRRWHHLSFLKSTKTRRFLARVEHCAGDVDAIRRLIEVIETDQGLPLHRAVEQTKCRLTDEDRTILRFELPKQALAALVKRGDFDAWIAPELDAIDGAVDEVLASAGVAAEDVDRVFTTGGASLVPAVRAALAERFGASRLVGGGELTSVAWGLAARCRELFGS